jgi:uncharacterized damage-inducible protein DinB
MRGLFPGNSLFSFFFWNYDISCHICAFTLLSAVDRRLVPVHTAEHEGLMAMIEGRLVDYTFFPVGRMPDRVTQNRTTQRTMQKGAAMELREIYLAQLDREATASRKAIERVPEGRSDWKPHEKSMELGKLASLSATMPGWLALMIERDELNLDDPSSEKFRTKPVETRAELARLLDENVAKARKALTETTEEHLGKHWRLVLGGQVLNDAPRHVMIADTFSHLAHHRGQLTVYLRLLGSSVPAIYGPSADEN